MSLSACQSEDVAPQTTALPALAGQQIVHVEDGEVTYSTATGFAQDFGDLRFILEPAHKARIASVSKLVAAIGAMQLVEQGVVDLDGDVSAWLGFELRNPSFPDTPITLRQLLAHTSSIRDGGRYWLLEGETFSDFFLPAGSLFKDGAQFANGENQAPGEFFHYSNLNFGVVAGIIEAASGQRFDLYMREHVLLPLGLDIGYSPCDITRTAHEWLATTYRKVDDNGNWDSSAGWTAQVDGPTIACYVGMDPIGRTETPPDPYLTDYQLASNPTYFSPQGGLRASAEDLSVIMRMLMNDGTINGVAILQPDTVSEMLTPQWTFEPSIDNGMTAGEDPPGGPADGLMTSYGLSVHIVDLEAWGLSPTTKKVYGHLGTAYGLLSQFWFDPETKDGFITIMTGLGDDPAKGEQGTSPLYPIEEAALRTWLAAGAED